MSHKSRKLFSFTLLDCELLSLSSNGQLSLESFSVLLIVPYVRLRLFLFAIFFALPILHALILPLFLFVLSPLEDVYVLLQLQPLASDVLPIPQLLISFALPLLRLQVLIALPLPQLQVSIFLPLPQLKVSNVLPLPLI